MTHSVDMEMERGWRRWLCACGWETEWTAYTSAENAAAAIRHQLQGNREGL